MSHKNSNRIRRQRRSQRMTLVALAGGVLLIAAAVLSEGKDNIGLFRHLPQPELPLPLPDPGKKEGGLSPPSFKNKGDLKF